ncbi:MAG: hypothetical protein LC754_16585 [Acidobacteria bacterium]|nr:hypothetical protein [Acidobacteriota bacterium]
MNTRARILIALTSLTILLGVAVGTRQNNAQRGRAPLTILQTSESLLDDVLAKKAMATAPHDGQSLYALTQSGDVIAYNRERRALKRIALSVPDVETFAVAPQGDVYLAGSDSKVRVVDPEGHRLKIFPVFQPTSLAVLDDGNLVVASPANDKLLHLYSPSGELLKSFGEMKPFDNDPGENKFLNRGKVAVGPAGEIYYVTMYAPLTYTAIFSKKGQLVKEFPIAGEAIDFQREKANGFLRDRKADLTGGITIINSAVVDPVTGNLWVGMNGLSTTATVYEYDPSGVKIQEYAFLYNSPSGRQNVTHVKDIVVRNSSITILSWGKLHDFKFIDTVAPETSAQKADKKARPTVCLVR